MTKKEATRILNIRLEALNEAIKRKVIKTDITGKIIDQSVFDYLNELEERRKAPPINWIKRNEF
jgi:hypothetical protein